MELTEHTASLPLGFFITSNGKSSFLIAGVLAGIAVLYCQRTGVPLSLWESYILFGACQAGFLNGTTCMPTRVIGDFMIYDLEDF